jgi:hypothetical protein
MTNLVIANFQTGYETDRIPSLINNDAFPLLENAYLFRGRLRRRRGTSFFGRLQREIVNQTTSQSTDGSGDFLGNLITIFSLATSSQIVTGSITITVGAETFTEPSPEDGTLVGSLTGTGTINYATGALTLTGAPLNTAVFAAFEYYPCLPVMGLEDFDKINNPVPVLVSFDTRFSYQFNQGTNVFYDTTFYKSTKNAFQWSGQDYQQFYTESYYDVLWATNNKPGFHFKKIEEITVNSATKVNIKITGHGLSDNDYVYINEATGGTGLNHTTSRVTVVDADNFTVVTVNATAGFANNSGIAQYLTSSVFASQDGIRWYDGDPTTAAAPNNPGWVNFAPPLSNAVAPQYLVGAKLVIAFQDRLLFFGPWVQSSTGNNRQLANSLIYSQNGTPFYSIAPATQTAQFQSWFSNVAGRGGRLGNGTDQSVVTAEPNDDVLIVGLEEEKKKLIATGDDILPFLYQSINKGLGDQSTFSAISLDEAVISLGSNGLLATSQNQSKRIDLKIPDVIFEISGVNNDEERSTAIRDFANELIFFSYVPKQANSKCKFPSKTLVYNYREANWSYYIENFTHYGYFRRSTGYTWATLPYDSWADWLVPWNYGGFGDRFPAVICGNQQGFVMQKTNSVSDEKSQYISSYSSGTIISKDHCLQPGNWIQLVGGIGVDFDGFVGTVREVTDKDTFIIQNPDPEIDIPTGTYLGDGTYRRLANFRMRTKEFFGFWDKGSMTIIGPQHYLIQSTNQGQMSVIFFSSSNDNLPISTGLVAPWLPYTNIILTSPEDASQSGRDRIWHKMNNSFIGDVVQFQFTLSDEQIADVNIQREDVEIHAIVINLEEGPEI